jgi:Putative bacterial sensory transduction regulator
VSEALDASALAGLERRIDEWLAKMSAGDRAIVAVDRAAAGDVADGSARWYVRMRGEEKEFTTLWLTLGQRTLRYETYVMPAPQENAAEVYEQALRRNERLVGAHFSIGVEDALFLRGELPLSALTEAELDRIVGSVYAYVEAAFPCLIRLGFASYFSA